MSKNLTPEELQNLQALNQEFTQVKLKLADSVYQQVLYTKDLDTIRGKFSSVEKELSEKYGANSVIDLMSPIVVFSSTSNNSFKSSIS